MKEAMLVLENGQVFKGLSFGAEGECFGEVIFNTNMMGYQELITEPAYCDNIIVMAYPLIGNYGVNKIDMNSAGAYLSGLVVEEYSKIASNWLAYDNLSNFMKRHKIIGIEDIDTRYLVRLIRNSGTLKGAITTKKQDIKSLIKRIKDKDVDSLIDKVSCKKTYSWNERSESERLAVVVDLGTNFTLLNWLADNKFRVKVVPYTIDYKKILAMKPEIVVFSNGCGNPTKYKSIINMAEEIIGKKPIFGFGLGGIILGIALGARAYKMKYGHHGSNYPVRDIKKGTTFLTAQDHIYCLKDNSITKDNEIISINMNDDTIEGFQSKKYKVLGLNYLPETLPIG